MNLNNLHLRVLIVSTILFNFEICRSQTYNEAVLAFRPYNPLGLFDMDGDGDLDLVAQGMMTVVSPHYNTQIAWIENDNDSVFNSIHSLFFPINMPESFRVGTVRVIDLDTDGDLDIIGVAASTGQSEPIPLGTLRIFLNDGIGNLYLKHEFPSVTNFDISDINQDGQPEIYASSELNLVKLVIVGDELVSAVLHTASGTINVDRFSTVEISDYDQDGIEEVAVLFNDFIQSEPRDYIYGFEVIQDLSPAPVLLRNSLPNSQSGFAGNIFHFQMADINNDEMPDIITNRQTNTGYSISLNQGGGTFGDWCPVSVNITGFSGYLFEAGDFNQDGELDLKSIRNTATGVYPYSFKLSYGCNYSDNNGLEDFWETQVDWNNDGHLDRLGLNRFTNNVMSDLLIYLSDGLGSFAETPETMAVSEYILPLGTVVYPATDLDNSGSFEVVSFHNQAFTFYHTDGDGLIQSNYSRVSPESGGVHQYTFEFYDLNGDEYPEFIFTASQNAQSTGSKFIYYYLNQNGILTTNPVLLYQNTSSNANTLIRALDIVDFDNDGDNDIFFILKTLGGSLSTANSNLYLMVNNGNLAFSTPVSLASGFALNDEAEISFINFDGDGDLDIVTHGFKFRNNGNNTVTSLGSIGFVNRNTLWMDIDQDGDKDAITRLVGTAETGFVKVYENNGAFEFTLIQQIVNGDAAVIFPIDIDSDGDLDFYTGNAVFKNENGQFSQIGSSGMSHLRIVPVQDGDLVAYYSGVISYDFVQIAACFGLSASISQNMGVLEVLSSGSNYIWTNCETGEVIAGSNSSQLIYPDQGNYSVAFELGICPLQTDCFSFVVLPGDFDYNGEVNSADLLLLLANYGCVFDDCSTDLDGDGVVGVTDIIIFLGIAGQ
jgi:hypothetical protein